MNNISFLILQVVIAIWIIRFSIPMWPHKLLFIALMLMLLAPVNGILTYTTGNHHLISSCLLIGYVVAPIVFCMAIFLNMQIKNEKRIRGLMLIPGLGLLIIISFKLFHWPYSDVAVLCSILPIGIGLYLMFNKKQLPETKVVEIISILLIIDFLRFLLEININF